MYISKSLISTKVPRIGLFTQRALKKGCLINVDAVPGYDFGSNFRTSCSDGKKIKQIGIRALLSLRHSWVSNENRMYFGISKPCIYFITPPEVLGYSSTANKIDDKITVFSANDPAPVELPPPNDVANPSYWKQFVNSREEYSRSTRLTNVELVQVETDIDQQKLPYGVALFQLKTTRSVRAGEELYLSYGYHWWMRRALCQLFLSAGSEELTAQIRWIEDLCGERSSEKKFPSLRLVKVSPVDGQMTNGIIANVFTGRRATDEDVLGYIVRRSCIDSQFAQKLMQLSEKDFSVLEESPSPDFTPDILIPFKKIRKLLAQTMLKELGQSKTRHIKA